MDRKLCSYARRDTREVLICSETGELCAFQKYCGASRRFENTPQASRCKVLMRTSHEKDQV